MEPSRPSSRFEFEIAIICALTIEADAVEALFDNYWDEEGPPYDKVQGDPNAYSTGSIGRHNVVLAHMPGMGTANASLVAANCRSSYPSVKLAIIVGVCGVVPFTTADNSETILGDVVVSTGVIQYDLGQQLPEQFVRKDTLSESLGRPNVEIRAMLGKLQGVRGRRALQAKTAEYLRHLQRQPELAARYPGAAQDRLFVPTYRHVTDRVSCDACGCDGELVRRYRLDQAEPQVAVHFGLIASGSTVMKSGKHRDDIAQREGVLAFEMESAGVWDSFPCVVIKGACDYADSHKTKSWQRYAAATAAACMKAYLAHWVPSISSVPERTRETSCEGAPFCYRCDHRSHVLPQCFATEKTVWQGRGTRMDEGRCTNCGASDHYWRVCDYPNLL